MTSFIEQIAPIAIKYGRANNILASLLISQSILESSSNTSELAVKANNLFGIKATNWTGAVYRKLTAEHKPDGTVYYIEADFRSYANIGECVQDLCAKYSQGLPFEKHNRYQAVIGETDYKKATQAVKAAGYATDVSYESKLNSVIEKYDLTKYDKEMTPKMSYTVVNKYIPTSLYPLKAPHAMTPQYVTIHNTYNDASAANEISYMTNNTSVTGYHVAIDDKQVIQAIPFNRNAYHAGDGQGQGNRASIGIEICYSKSGGSRYYEAEENTVEYTAHLLKQYGWGIDRIKWHRDWSGKLCPHRMISEGRLDSFKKRVQVKLDELNGKKPPIVADSTPSKPNVQPKPQETIKPKETMITMSMLKGTSSTLNNAFLKYLEDAAKKGIVQDKWAKSYKAGELPFDDAFLIYVYIKEELNK